MHSINQAWVVNKQMNNQLSVEKLKINNEMNNKR